MILSGRKLFYFLILFIIPLILWVVPVLPVNTFFLLILLLYLVSRYWKKIQILHETLEIILFYLALSFLTDQIGLDKYFPANTVAIILLMYIYLFSMMKADKRELFFFPGKIKGTFSLVILFTILSIASLSIWFIFQTENPYAPLMPDLSLPVLIPLGIGFAIINAVYEEGIFRSILLSQFSRELEFGAAVILQSIWFSFLHFQSGFPSGVIGIGLTFIFGLMMGHLVFRTKGILIPVVVHAIADFSIFILILLKIQQII